MEVTNQVAVLSTPSDMDEAGREKVSEGLNKIVADLLGLYVKTKNYHWHMSGRHFRDYHLLLDKQANQILEAVDIVAERIRKIGFTTIRSIGHIAQLQRVKDNDEDFVAPLDMLTDLMEENKRLATNLRQSHEECEDIKDVATASVLEVFIDEAERRTWFLFETTRELN